MLEPDVEGPVRSLGKRRVLVAREVREGRSGDLDELEVTAAGLVVGDRDNAVGSAGELQAGGAGIASVSAEQAIRRGEAPVLARHVRGGERKLPAEHGEALHVRVLVEEGGADLEQPLLEASCARPKRDRVDEVLHRVGRHDLAVVALRVGVEELGAVD